MSYLSNVQLFGEFDRDTLYRSEGALYLSAVQQILNSASDQESATVRRMWSLYNAAVRDFYDMDYYGMVVKAQRAYQLALGL
ncbi:MAG: hypothetical protein ACE5KC_02315 [Candidatus Bathyarchaeia archaeon]